MLNLILDAITLKSLWTTIQVLVTAEPICLFFACVLVLSLIALVREFKQS